MNASVIPTPDPGVSVILATRNRADSLRRAVRTLLTATACRSFELLIVDNGSSDSTPAVARELERGGQPVRYVVEPRPGVAYARNRGVAEARAPIVAFTDDDQQPAGDWVSVITRTFEAHSGLHFVAGRVLPAAGTLLPEWVTSRTGGALSIIDRGAAPAPIDPAHWMCVPGGNMAVRRDVFRSVGGLAGFSRSQDRELTVRLLQSGYVGRYVPEMLMYHDLDPGRITRGYFRRWVATEGRTRARYRFDELFDRDGRLLPAPLRGRRVLGVSAFIYRELIAELVRWARASLRGRRPDAFAHELRARYLSCYVIGAMNMAGEINNRLGPSSG